ncbi:MAG: PolC-type DNA polymerase III [Gemmatimonadales bacterium]
MGAVPASSLTARAVSFLESGPAGSLAIVRDVLGIVRANRHTADRIAATLLAPDPRFRRTDDGRWTLAVRAPEASPALDACRYAVVDVETTGVRAFSGDRIMEIAVVRLDGTIAFHSLVNPGIPIPQFVASLTGIDAAVVRKAPPFEDIVDDLLAALEGCVFVAHNARFDWAFVSTEIERARGLLLQGPRVCTVRLARRLLPDLPRRNLDWVSGYFGIEIEGRHRAVGDAVAAAKCLGRMLRMARDDGATCLADLENVRHVS